jgi:hypothetical protein
VNLRIFEILVPLNAYTSEFSFFKKNFFWKKFENNMTTATAEGLGLLLIVTGQLLLKIF